VKIHFDNVNPRSNSGPNTFGVRLADGLVKAGHHVTLTDPWSADVSLVFIEPSGRDLAKKIVHRLDGIWFKPEDFHTKNVGIKGLYDRADAIIWQSDFDRTMTVKHWGDRQGRVIRNGIDVNRVTVRNPELWGLRQRYDHIFVSSANWHPQKRLNSNIEFFQRLRNTTHRNSCLIVMGNESHLSPRADHVFSTGSLSHELCLEAFSVADWMIHLAWLDHCPNVVVEALSQNCPVVCSSSGGTKELVGGYGVIVEDASYDFEPMNYDYPPTIDTSSVVLPHRSLLGAHADISMSSVVNAYVKLFTEIV
jgi:glycosyltransferase involved in cell wall biosynthesis